MKNLFLLLAAFCILLMANFSYGQPDKSEFLVEIDPLTFALGGVGAHVGWSPKGSEHFTVGLSLLSGLEFPDAMINLDSRNKGKGWDVKINQGMGIWGHYYLNERNRGFFVGLQFFTQEMKLTNSNLPDESDLTNTILLAGQIGYMYFPFKNVNIYLRPWAGLGYQSVISGSFQPDKVDPDLMLGDKEYFLPSIVPFVAVHVGYKF